MKNIQNKLVQNKESEEIERLQGISITRYVLPAILVIIAIIAIAIISKIDGMSFPLG